MRHHATIEHCELNTVARLGISFAIAKAARLAVKPGERRHASDFILGIVDAGVGRKE